MIARKFNGIPMPNDESIIYNKCNGTSTKHNLMWNDFLSSSFKFN